MGKIGWWFRHLKRFDNGKCFSIVVSNFELCECSELFAFKFLIQNDVKLKKSKKLDNGIASCSNRIPLHKNQMAQRGAQLIEHFSLKQIENYPTSAGVFSLKETNNGIVCRVLCWSNLRPSCDGKLNDKSCKL